MPFSSLKALPAYKLWYIPVQITSVLLGMVLVLQAPQIATGAFFLALAAHILCFAVSLGITARIMAETPVRTYMLVGSSLALAFFTWLVRLDWLSALHTFLPLLVITVASGMLYTYLLVLIRLHREKTGYYSR